MYLHLSLVAQRPRRLNLDFPSLGLKKRLEVLSSCYWRRLNQPCVDLATSRAYQPRNLSWQRAICLKGWQVTGLTLIEGVTRWVSRN